MQAHPVPQNITGFEFKLIGALTLRQFGYVGGAGIICLLIFALPIFTIIKIVLILPVGLLGLALAFLPVNDMPFDRWIVAGIRLVYSPNERVWRKKPVEIGFLAPEFSIYLQRQKVPAKPLTQDRTKLQKFLASNRRAKRLSMLDLEEEKKLSQLNQQTSTLSFRTSEAGIFPKAAQNNPDLGVSRG